MAASNINLNIDKEREILRVFLVFCKDVPLNVFADVSENSDLLGPLVDGTSALKFK